MNIIFNEHWKTTEVLVKKSLRDSEIEVTLVISDGFAIRSFRFSGSRDVDELMSIFHAWRIEITEDIESQKEFGRFTLSFTYDSYSEIYFDTCNEIIQT
jgi:hypothetical protein